MPWTIPPSKKPNQVVRSALPVQGEAKPAKAANAAKKKPAKKKPAAKKGRA